MPPHHDTSDTPSSRFSYTAAPVHEDGVLTDVRVVCDGKTRHLGGKRGRENEIRRVQDAPLGDGLPVLLGSGLGAGLAEMLALGSGPVAVVDAEEPVWSLTGLPELYRNDERILWIAETDPEAVLGALTRWQMQCGGRPFIPIIDPFYARLRPDLYRVLGERLAASREINFWAKARYPKFTSSIPRILLVTSSYFLMGEIEAACTRLGYATCFVQLPSQEIGSQEFVERMLTDILTFRPDFVLTINHLGVDKEGILTNLLARLELPLASWFVDNPHLILYLYENLSSDWVTLFTWDVDNIASLKRHGFERVHYLPLATDPHRFSFRTISPARDVAFVGNSMVYKARAKIDRYQFPQPLLDSLHSLAAGFMASGELSVAGYMEQEHPTLAGVFRTITDVDERLAFETLVTWQATLVYRLERVRRLLPFSPLIVGDPGWHEILPESGWQYHKELSYYDDLPAFYPATAVNFNCTSQQMKGAVNQRVFDVPVCGGFLLTDHRRQMEELFEPGTEIICYQEPEEIEELVRRYLNHESERRAVTAAARRRILAEHTYDLRLQNLTAVMRRTYGRS